MSEPERRDPPAVVDGVLQRLSVSQMQKADAASGGCLRKWRFSKVEKPFPEPESAGQKRGKAGHKRIEDFLKGGPRSGLETLELLGLQRGHIPQPSPLLSVERAMEWRALDVPIVGYVDLIDAGSTPHIKDWKYKKPWDGKLGFDAEDLIDPNHEAGIQMIGYAQALAGVMSFDAVALSHVTFQTSGRPDVRQVTSALKRAEIAPLWEIISRRIVPKMQAAARAAKPQDVEPNESACHKYGGCVYLSVCQDRMARIVAGFKNQAPQKVNQMGLMSSLVAAPPAVIVPPPPQAPVAPPPPPKSRARIQDLAGVSTQGALYMVNGCKARYVCNASVSGSEFASFAPLAGGPPLLVAKDHLVTELPPDGEPIVLPPDAPKSDPVLAAKPAPGTFVGVTNEALVVTDAPKIAETPVEATKTAETQPEAPKSDAPKRGRPKKDATVSTNPPAPAAPSPVAESVAEAVRLYVNCSPIGVITQTLHAYVGELETLLYKQAQLDVFDLRSANDAVFGFGKWKGFLAKATAEYPLAPGHYVVSTGGDERIDTVAQALIGAGAQAVIGR